MNRPIQFHNTRHKTLFTRSHTILHLFCNIYLVILSTNENAMNLNNDIS